MIDRLRREDVRRWLDAYIEAWRSSAPDAIADLFTEDVRYEPEPYVVLDGVGAVVNMWLEEPDPPGSWQARYEPAAIDGWVAVATGTSRYLGGEGERDTVFHNVFLLEFANDGRCRHYREWYMREP